MSFRHRCFLGLVALCGACGGSTRVDDGSLEVEISASDPSARIARVEIGVVGPDLPAPIGASAERASSGWRGTVAAIPPGGDRTLHVTALDASGMPLASREVSPVAIDGDRAALVIATLVLPGEPLAAADTPLLESVVVSRALFDATEPVSLTAHARPGDARDLTFAWSADGGLLESPSSPFTRWTPGLTDPALLGIAVRGSLGSLAGANFTLVAAQVATTGKAKVTATFNTWPVVSSMTTAPGRIDVGGQTNLAVTATDADKDKLSYAWSATCTGRFSAPTSAKTTFTLTAPSPSASCALVVTVTDGSGGRSTGTSSIQTGPGPLLNLAPAIDSTFQSLPTAHGGDSVVFRVAAHDPEGTPITIAWSSPTGALSPPTNTINTSEVTWTAAPCQAGASSTVVAVVRDPAGASRSQPFLIACR